jgi:hypothetical protein
MGLVYAGALYLLIGLGVAVTFVAAGIPRALGGAVAMTLGARLIIVPGAVLLWPLVLRRWLEGRTP